MIHDTAIIDSSASLHQSVKVGPYSVIGADVSIGENTVIESHCVIKGPTTIGKNCHFFQFSTIGEATPDLKYNGEKTTLTIGDFNVFREGVTVHRGTIQDKSDTFIGNNNLIMAYTHIGHDCVLGNNCILINNAALAGHVIVGDWAIIGGYTGINQRCHIGAHSYVGTMSKVTQDIPAFILADGRPAKPRMLNVEGLRRRNFDEIQIKKLQDAFKILYRKKLSLGDALLQLKKSSVNNQNISLFVDSIESSKNGIIRN